MLGAQEKTESHSRTATRADHCRPAGAFDAPFGQTPPAIRPGVTDKPGHTETDGVDKERFATIAAPGVEAAGRCNQRCRQRRKAKAAKIDRFQRLQFRLVLSE